ncbi:MAG: site-specific integrase [Dehalococcoidia bacterium]
MRGHIRKRVHTTKNGRQTVTWYVVVELPRDENGKRRQKWHGGFGTRKEAEAARARLVHELNLGTYVEPNALTLSEWVREHWFPTVKSRVKPSTFDSYRRNLELHVLNRLGGQQLRQLTPTMLNRLYADLLTGGHRKTDGGLSAKTVRYIHTIIHKALADAVDADMVATNVAARSKPPRPRSTTPSEIGFWEPHELRAFLESVRGHRLEAAWRVAAMTGMRRGEVLGLRWRDIDLDAARIAVRQALVSVAYEVTVSTPKTHQARTIDLDPGTVDQLRAHRHRQEYERKEWGSDYHDRDLAFCKENGTLIHPHTLSQAFERLVARSDLPHIRLHDLRHTHATIALKAGVPVKVISERLGHETPAFTMKQYAHVIPGMQAEAAAEIAQLVTGSSPHLATSPEQ